MIDRPVVLRARKLVEQARATGLISDSDAGQGDDGEEEVK
jgi:hypothetical protein